jgi:hypothetical protein
MKILARKNILLSDPKVGKMNDTQWIAEAVSYNIENKNKIDNVNSIFEVSRKLLIRLLGLNVMPIEEKLDDGVVRLKLPNDEEIVPLSLLTSSPEVIGEVMKKIEEFNIQEELGSSGAMQVNELSPDEIDSLVDGGDIEFSTGNKHDINSPEYRKMMSKILTIIDDSDENKSNVVESMGDDLIIEDIE